MKKILLMLSIMLMPMMYFSQSAYADSGCTGNETFFGLPAWYRGLVTSGENGCQIKEIGPNDAKNKHEITIEQFVWTVVYGISNCRVGGDGIHYLRGISIYDCCW